MVISIQTEASSRRGQGGPIIGLNKLTGLERGNFEIHSTLPQLNRNRKLLLGKPADELSCREGRFLDPVQLDASCTDSSSNVAFVGYHPYCDGFFKDAAAFECSLLL